MELANTTQGGGNSERASAAQIEGQYTQAK